MCTVTVISLSGKCVRLACNRDERLSRPAALPPRVRRFGRRRAVLPVDPASGGTWVAVSDAGIAMALLNVNDGGLEPDAAPPRSRGTIIPALLHGDGLDAVVSQASALNPAEYAPFRLVIVEAEQAVELRCDGAAVRPARGADLDRPLMFTSSGLGDLLVEGPRAALFADVFAAGDAWAARQEAFHRHRWDDRPHLSVCMRRPDARTVSHTVVTLLPNRVALTYRPDAPDRPAEVFSASLALPRGGAA